MFNIQLSLELLSSAVASPCTLRLVVAAAALIWRFSFEIIRSEKSPTAASTPNRDADTVENIC